MCHADDNLRDREQHCVTFGDYNQYFSVLKSLYRERATHINFQRASYLGAYATLVNVLTPNNSTHISIYSGKKIKTFFIIELLIIRSIYTS